MPTFSLKILAGTAAVSLVLLSAALSPAAAQIQQTPERAAMEACVRGVLDDLEAKKGSEDSIESLLGSVCERQLRAALEAAIRTKEAADCTVQSCLRRARIEAAEKARLSYRQRLGRQ